LIFSNDEMMSEVELFNKKILVTVVLPYCKFFSKLKKRKAK